MRLQSLAGNAAVGELLAGRNAPAGPGAAGPGIAGPPGPPSPLAPPATQLTDLAAGDHAPTTELLAGLEADFAAHQAGALDHVASEEARLDEAQTAAVGRLDAGHQAESAALDARAAQARTTVVAAHEAHTQQAGTAHAAHLANIDTWHQGQWQQVTTGLDASAADVHGRAAAASQQVDQRTDAAHQEATAHVDQRRQDIRGLEGGGGGGTPREKGHAEVASHVKDQADKDLASKSADSLDQLRTGGGQAAGKLAEQGGTIATKITDQAPQLQAQVDDTAAGARSAAADTLAQTQAALGAARDHSTASIDDVRSQSRSALAAQRDRAQAELAENTGKAKQSIRDSVGGALTASGAQLRSALAPLAGQRLGPAQAAQARSELGAALDQGAAQMRQQVTDSASGIGTALVSGGDQAAQSMNTVTAKADPVLGSVVDHHSSVGSDVLGRVDAHQQQAAQSLTSQGTAAVSQSLTGVAQAGQQAAAELENQAGQISGQIDAQAAQTKAAADNAVSTAPGRIADGKSKVDAKLPEKKADDGGILSAIGDWFKQQWDDFVEMIKDPGFWVGLVVAIVVTVVLAPVLGPFALVVAGAAAGAAAQMTHNVIAGKPLFDGVLKAAALGALGGAIFAVATVIVVLAGLEGLAALAVFEVATVIVTLVTNAITGQPLTKGLLANMLLVGILHAVFKYFSGPIVDEPVIDPDVDPVPDPSKVPDDPTKVPDDPNKTGPDPDKDQTDPDKEQPAPDEEPYVACFLPGTPVLTVDGLRSIETISAGDQVYGRPAEGAGPTAPSLVAAAFQGSALRVRRVRVDGGELLVTRSHRFRLASGRWKQARELEAGDGLETFAGDPALVASVADVAWPAGVATHNLTVPAVSTYFVGVGGVAVLVHNGPPKPKPLPNFNRRLFWVFGNKAKVRDTDVDGKSMWETNSKEDVDKFFEARVNGDKRPLDDDHAFYDEAALKDAGIELPVTPGAADTAVTGTGLPHHSARPPGADPDPKVDLTPEQIQELQAKFDAVPKTKVTAKQLKGTCG